MSRKHRRWGGWGYGWDDSTHPRVTLETSYRAPWRLTRYERENTPASVSFKLEFTLSAGRSVGGGGSGPTSRSYTGRRYHLTLAGLGAYLHVKIERPIWRETKERYEAQLALYHRKCDLIHSVALEQGCPHEDNLHWPSRSSNPTRKVRMVDGEVTTFLSTGSTQCSMQDCRKSIYFTEGEMDFIMPKQNDPAIGEAIASIQEATA